MTRPAVPLEKAVAEAREALAHDSQAVPGARWLSGDALYHLLAALDADKRLELAEAALREVMAKVGRADECGRYDAVGDFHECDDQKPSEEWCSLCIARRYFARREGEKGEERAGER